MDLVGIDDWLQRFREALDPEAHAEPAPPWPAPTDAWPRNPAFEDTLRTEPSSKAHLSIYADWLAERDVRGEVLAAALAGHGEAARWGAVHVHPGAALEGWMLGPLARTLELGPKHMEQLRGTPFSFASCSILQTLRVFAQPTQVASLLEARHDPCPIRTLLIGAGYDDLTPLWPVLGTIGELHVDKARSLGTIRAPELQTLRLRTLAKHTYQDLSGSWPPCLTTLELQTEPDDSGTALSAALTALPLLQTLQVRSAVSAAFLHRVVQAGCGARLRTLGLPGARWDTIAALLHHADSFERLEHLTLPTLPDGDRIELTRTFGHTQIEWSASSGLLHR